MTEQTVNGLTFNKLSESQYSGTTPVDGQFYITPESDYALNDKVVHNTGKEDVGGIKVIVNTPTTQRPELYFANKNPNQEWSGSIVMYDTNEVAGGYFENFTTDANFSQSNIVAHRVVNDSDVYSTVSAAVDGNGYCYGKAPHMSLDSTNDEIVTALRLRELMNVWFGSWICIREFRTLYNNGAIGAGTINLTSPYTDCSIIIAEGGNDSNGNRTFYCQPSWNITTSRNWGTTWTLWTNGMGQYWSCAASSSTTSFISNTENSIINNIYGIIF